MTVRIITGDCRDVLPTLPAESVDCIVTSPPYFGLRDYGVEGQIGLEPTLQGYIEEMVVVCRELRRVLKPEGTFWLNIGDSYAGGGRGGNPVNSYHQKQKTNAGSLVAATPMAAFGGLKPKDLCMVPARLALALQADGWWVRSEIIWAKPNPMPESVSDRPTSAHEKIYLLTKSRRYQYDTIAVREKAVSNHPSGNGFKRDARLTFQNAYGEGRGNSMQWQVAEHRNLRNVWSIATRPYADAHFATFPPELAMRCIQAGCPVGGSVLDPFGGAGTTGLVADALGRSATLIELNPAYVDLARKRIDSARAPLFAEAAEMTLAQTLFELHCRLKNLTGLPWSGLPPYERAYWQHMADAARDYPKVGGKA